MSHSQIYFVDETGAFWPVTTVTYKWNEAQGVDSFYVTSCPRSGLICPHVVEYNGASGSPDPTCNTAYGCTTRTLLPGSAKHYGTARVYLNNATVNTATQARKTTCHELGHVLGLEHRVAGFNGSCMTQGAAPPISAYPDTHDFDQLETTYAHSN